MADDRTERPSPPDTGGGPGIIWEPGEEDYPFPAKAGETALDYFERWLDGAAYARVERHGARFIHEADVANLLNHITADVGLLRARLGRFGDRVVTADEHAATVSRIEVAMAQLREALDKLDDPQG
jgi:hypothetical protein